MIQEANGVAKCVWNLKGKIFLSEHESDTAAHHMPTHPHWDSQRSQKSSWHLSGTHFRSLGIPPSQLPVRWWGQLVWGQDSCSFRACRKWGIQSSELWRLPSNFAKTSWAEGFFAVKECSRLVLPRPHVLKFYLQSGSVPVLFFTSNFARIFCETKFARMFPSCYFFLESQLVSFE